MFKSYPFSARCAPYNTSQARGLPNAPQQCHKTPIARHEPHRQMVGKDMPYTSKAGGKMYQHVLSGPNHQQHNPAAATYNSLSSTGHNRVQYDSAPAMVTNSKPPKGWDAPVKTHLGTSATLAPRPSIPAAYNARPSKPTTFNARSSTPAAFNARPATPTTFNARPSTPATFNARPSTPATFNARPAPHRYQPHLQLSMLDQHICPTFNARPSTPATFNARPSTSATFNARPSTPATFNARPSTPATFNARPGTPATSTPSQTSSYKITDSGNRITSRQNEKDLRVLTATIEGMQHWSKYNNNFMIMFEVFGKCIVDSAVVSRNRCSQTFTLRDDSGPIQCVFFEIVTSLVNDTPLSLSLSLSLTVKDRVFPRLIRGQWYRCVGQYDASRETLQCVSVRAASAEERQRAPASVEMCDTAMRAAVSLLCEA
ncbi:PREDICTED: adhesive plaque matrix protein-like [Priapulus caudatus]|uniref:Adhesive plaque matrix protein-like n=1 Tax=Priapulus caudatus TaxID=37621 RepID=A0ABM1EPW3_PRICU|nr:PREDICTED: adhesive plaque matrix protein-like [Priapulus caudatus]